MRALDDAQNVATGCVTVVVPYDGEPASLAAVLLQAEEARAACAATASAPEGFSRLVTELLPKNGTPRAR